MVLQELVRKKPLFQSKTTRTVIACLWLLMQKHTMFVRLYHQVFGDVFDVHLQFQCVLGWQTLLLLGVKFFLYTLSSNVRFCTNGMQHILHTMSTIFWQQKQQDFQCLHCFQKTMLGLRWVSAEISFWADPDRPSQLKSLASSVARWAEWVNYCICMTSGITIPRAWGWHRACIITCLLCSWYNSHKEHWNILGKSVMQHWKRNHINSGC